MKGDTGHPSDRRGGHLELEEEAKALFDTSYGAKPPAASRDVGNGLAVRLTFGWPRSA